MLLREKEWLQFLEEIPELNNVAVTIRESRNGGYIAFCTTVIGGLVLGPPGLAVGGIIGGITAAWRSSGKFKCITTAIKEDYTIAEKKELFSRLGELISELEFKDIKELITIVLNDPYIQQMIKDILVTFVVNYAKNKI